MLWSNRAEILDDLAQHRIVNVEPDLIAASAGPVNPTIGSGHKRTHLAAEPGDDLAAFLDHVCRRVINKQVHTPRFPRWRSDVVLAVEAKCAARQIELVAVGQALLLYFARAEINRKEPGRSVVFLEVDLE